VNLAMVTMGVAYAYYLSHFFLELSFKASVIGLIHRLAQSIDLRKSFPPTVKNKGFFMRILKRLTYNMGIANGIQSRETPSPSISPLAWRSG
jgi:hypothetical protein